ncbi:MAG: hypothetical protein VXY81_12630, partial [Pseudomonadota bacterium]|nr:hypothetical protein [Pseudomonadota bacterium]
ASRVVDHRGVAWGGSVFGTASDPGARNLGELAFRLVLVGGGRLGRWIVVAGLVQHNTLNCNRLNSRHRSQRHFCGFHLDFQKTSLGCGRRSF